MGFTQRRGDAEGKEKGTRGQKTENSRGDEALFTA